jgi:hypothetical protein
MVVIIMQSAEIYNLESPLEQGRKLAEQEAIATMRCNRVRTVFVEIDTTLHLCISGFQSDQTVLIRIFLYLTLYPVVPVS